MKKLLLLVLILFISAPVFAENDYSKIQYIGNKKVEYDLNGRILKIGDEYVTYSTPNHRHYYFIPEKSKVFNPDKVEEFERDPEIEIILGAFEGPVLREFYESNKSGWIYQIGDNYITHKIMSKYVNTVGENKIIRNKQHQIISIGEKKIIRDKNGVVEQIGNDIVYRYKNGIISAVGNKKYFRNENGSVYYIGNVKYTLDKNGYVIWINSQRIDYAPYYERVKSINKKNGDILYFYNIHRSLPDELMGRGNSH